MAGGVTNMQTSREPLPQVTSQGRFSNANEMVREELRPLEQRTKDNEARLAWLRGAASEAFASLDRGEGLQFESMDELENYNF